jgi:hypothetical protein
MTLSMGVASMPKRPKLLALPKQILCFKMQGCRIVRQPFYFFSQILARFGAVLTFAPKLRHAPVAQWIEHLPSKQRVAGSSPAGGAIFIVIDRLHSYFPWTSGPLADLARHLSCRSSKRH